MNNKVFLFIYGKPYKPKMYLLEMDDARKEVPIPGILDLLEELHTYAPKKGLIVLRLPDLMPDYELHQLGHQHFLATIQYMTKATGPGKESRVVRATSERHALAILERRVRSFMNFFTIESGHCKKL